MTHYFCGRRETVLPCVFLWASEGIFHISPTYFPWCVFGQRCKPWSCLNQTQSRGMGPLWLAKTRMDFWDWGCAFHKGHGKLKRGDKFYPWIKFGILGRREYLLRRQTVASTAGWNRGFGSVSQYPPCHGSLDHSRWDWLWSTIADLRPLLIPHHPP